MIRWKAAATALVCLATTLTGCGPAEERRIETIPLGTVRKIDVAIETTLKIVAGDRPELTRTLYFREGPDGFPSGPTGPSHRLDGDALVLEECPERLCSVEYKLTLPAGDLVVTGVPTELEVTGAASVDVTVKAWNITVSGVSGSVRINGEAEKVAVTHVGGDVALDMIVGETTVDDVGGGLAVPDGMGNYLVDDVRGGVAMKGGAHLIGHELGLPIDIDAFGYADVDLAEPGSARIVSRGGVVVRLPEAEYRVTVSGGGILRNPFVPAPTSPHHIDVTATGDVLVYKQA
ncbi:hypothetical protein [Actinokineospora sp. HUAS TT18]|uniref:hypothetical protein n=1 Tax=Actinokineospora sp. HUAS TT18 TaxID=3447451 RepID=UPI003F521B2C